MLGKTPQYPNEITRKQQNGSSIIQGGSPTDSELLTGSTMRQNVDPNYLRQHHKTSQAN